MRTHLLLVVLALSHATVSVAEDNDEVRAVFNPDTFSPLATLRDADVKFLLKQDAEQKRRLAQIDESWNLAFAAFSNQSASNRDEDKLDTTLDDHEQQAKHVLSAEQWRDVLRLKTILFVGCATLERVHGGIYRDELQLSDEQSKAVDAAHREWLQAALVHLSKEVSNGDGQDLSSTQRRWRELKSVESLNNEQERKFRQQLTSLLSQPQQVRFAQLEFQQVCLASRVFLFAGDAIQEELEFSAAQRQRVSELIAGLPEERLYGQRFKAEHSAYLECLEMLDAEQMVVFRAKLGEVNHRRGWILAKEPDSE